MTFDGNTAAGMNNSNIRPFFEKIAQDPVLQEKVRQICKEYPDQIPHKAVELSREIELPVTMEELKALKAAAGVNGELSEVELDGVSGGISLEDLAPYARKVARTILEFAPF